MHLTVPWLVLSVLIVVGYGGLVGRRHPDLPVLAAYGVSIALVGCLLFSILLHELGHALAARRHGVPVRRITLDLLGGHTELMRSLPRPGAEIAVALLGPAVSLLLGLAWLAAWLLVGRRLPAGDLLLQLAVVNLIVAGYNALPGLPLDGGRALGGLVWAVTGRRDLGDEVAGWTGRLVAGATLLLGCVGYLGDRYGAFGLGVFTVVGLSLWSGAGQAVRQARTARRVPGLSAGGLARPLRAVPAGTPLSQLPPTGRGRAELGVVDSAGRLIGLLDPATAARVPTRRRPWTTAVEVSAPVAAGDWLPAALSGTQLLARIAGPADPTRGYPVALDQDGVGVLRIADVLRALRGGPRRRSPRPTAAPPAASPTAHASPTASTASPTASTDARHT